MYDVLKGNRKKNLCSEISQTSEQLMKQSQALWGLL